jgi:hypothetical protein
MVPTLASISTGMKPVILVATQLLSWKQMALLPTTVLALHSLPLPRHATSFLITELTA